MTYTIRPMATKRGYRTPREARLAGAGGGTYGSLAQAIQSQGAGYLRPYSQQAITVFGQPEYKAALEDWRKQYGSYESLMKDLPAQLKETMAYYKPGGGYGQGLRQEAEETVRGGVAGDIGQMIASGMSSAVGARGVQTRAASELSKLYKNIEDTRNQLLMQSFGPYAQAMQTLASMQQARPSYGQYVQPVTTSKSGYGWY